MERARRPSTLITSVPSESRLTTLQFCTLMSADLTRPIYGENEPHRINQMPGGQRCYHLRTIESLEKRGYLKSDGQAGYLLTQAGLAAVLKR